MRFMYPVSGRKPLAGLRKISHFSHKSRRRMQIPIRQALPLEDAAPATTAPTGAKRHVRAGQNVISLRGWSRPTSRATDTRGSALVGGHAYSFCADGG